MQNKHESPQTQSYQQRIEAAFPALCWARAYHWSQGEHSLQEAVDWCQDWAVTRGLVEFIGQDAVQAIMAEAWLPWRAELDPQTFTPPPPKTTGELPASMIDAAEYLIRERDPARFKAWLLEHTREEQAAIVAHLENKRRPA